jgi:hypothetical protein
MDPLDAICSIKSRWNRTIKSTVNFITSGQLPGLIEAALIIEAGITYRHLASWRHFQKIVIHAAKH